MNLQSKIINIFVKVFSLAFLSIFLFACNFPSKVSSLPSSPTPQIKTPPIESFSIQDANNIAPNDILQEVYYSTGGGGGGGCSQKTYSEPALEQSYYYESARAEWLGGFRLLVCGWDTNEVVTITIKFPDGKVTEEKTTTILIATLDGNDGVESILYDYKPSISDQVGVYSFLFEGKSGSVRHDVTVYVPSEPRMYYLSDINAFYLYGYSPNERLRFFVYTRSNNSVESKSNLTAWKEYYVNDYGQLIIKTEIGYDDIYFVVGDISGENIYRGYHRAVSSILSPDSPPSLGVTSCQSNLPSLLQIGKYAYLSTNPPLNVRVRSNAGLNGDSLGFIESGDIAEILEGPQCVDGMTWWKVKSTANPNLIGWSSEGDTKYLLFPCSSSSSCP